MKIPENVKYIENSAFLNNRLKKLEFLVDDDKKCSLVSIGAKVFEGSNNSNVIEELYFPNSKNTNGYTLGSDSFKNNKIKKITLSSSVILLETSVFSGNNIELVKVLGENKNRYNSVWTQVGFPSELKIY